ncbi:MoaD/ThiS family protein [Carboxydothermus pertinax]|uniref:Molybdopterin synthase sulfur carrier subunit n=1 Tax=Carboxydothermus pertinax TaxID=870242 RepID=A0A1L8CUU1_9THEO|nr:MoaD/ThiS family protein [Carboxydothermus pertinax]GAV22624.1 molybdopterin synthase sulfur carrier subunit [Carboxydothermus pertinax]
MKIEIRLFATFREGRFKKEVWELPEGTKVIDVLQRLKINPEEVAILLVNGLDGTPEQVLNDGDYISLFPPVGGG